MFPDAEELAPPLAAPARVDPEALLLPVGELAVFVPTGMVVTTGASLAVAGGAEVAGGSVVDEPVLTAGWVVAGRPGVIETGVWADCPCSEAGMACRGAVFATTGVVELVEVVEVVDVPGWWAVTNAWQKVVVPAGPPWAAMSALKGGAEAL